MEKEIVVTLVLDDKLAAQFQTASKLVVTESDKMSKATQETFKSANTEVVKVGQTFNRFSGSMSSFATNVIRGDVLGAFQSLSSIGVAGLKALTIQTALATGGITLALGGIALLINAIRSNHAELKKMQKELKADQEKQAAFELAVMRAGKEKETEENERWYDQQLVDIADRGKRESDVFKKQHIKTYADLYKHKTDLALINVKYQDEMDDLDKEYANRKLDIEDKYYWEPLEKIQKENEENNKKVKGIEKKTALTMEAAWLGKEIRVYQDGADEKIKIEKEVAEKKTALQKEQDALDAAMVRDRNARGAEALRMSVANLGYLSTQIKEFKEVYKAAAMVQTAVDTIVGAQGIFKNIASASYLGPFALPLAVAGAGIAYAAGMARVAEISKYERGGDFTTSGPRMIMVGDNPGGQERVSITPMSSPNYNGPVNSPSINMGNVYISGNADGGTVRAFERANVKRMKALRQDLLDLGYARQMPSFA